jgi:hypothetical protein
MVMTPAPDAAPSGSEAGRSGRGSGGVTSMRSPTHYEITVEGALDAHWSGWFEGLRVASDARGRTTISGPVADQAALHGLLAKVRDLGLPLIGVQRLEPD